MFSCKPKEDDSAITPQTNKINGHEYVDLGLPSGLKWATCNVGASSPERRGNYYAWGEIINKDYYNYDNCYTYNNEDIPDISGKVKYDVARKEWGGTWRIPKRNEMRELIDECAWELVYENDIYAYKVTGPNSKYILLPVTGRYEKYTIENYGNSGYYWTSTPDKTNDYSTNAYCLFFDDEYEIELEKRVRYYGQAVRPVSE
jgi:hypothetical protein